MKIDVILMGQRFRKVREEYFEETTKEFAKRCNVSERYIRQIERGDFQISLQSLVNISACTNIDLDYFVFGKFEKVDESLLLQKKIYTIIDRASKEELEVFHKILTNIKNFEEKIIKNEENKKIDIA
ncbi:MAG: helix-turn-helix transcriptional regulator [Clostridia bacterium]|nr:helix-turn-helix transcriptional regulator [Clostridia bacterium]MBP3801742.1 helix-turn-helix transcriptional regulator [Clostridia bacterium]